VITLRRATPSDAAAIGDIYLASRRAFLPYAPIAHSDAEVRCWIADYLILKTDITVATLDGDIVGMMALKRDDTVGWIDQLYVRPDVVGQGIGTLLLERAKTELGPPIRLYTFQANEGARRFYERYGFVAIAFGDGSKNEERCPDVCYEWRG